MVYWLTESAKDVKTEKQTRKEIIDKELLRAGWKVDDSTKVIEEFEIAVGPRNETRESRSPYHNLQFSDYVLLGKDGKPLAVVEAKKTTKDAEIGREQAKQYCQNIQNQFGGELPFCFYTNGHEIYFWDIGNYPPRKVVGFPTRDDLERFQYIRRNRKPLTRELVNTSIAGRDYQIRAIRAVLEGIEQKKRDFLLVMATGTGKTRICIAMVDALMRAGHAEKILFLVDRIALREQALAAFKEYLPNEPRWPTITVKRSLPLIVVSMSPPIPPCSTSFGMNRKTYRLISSTSSSSTRVIAPSTTPMGKSSTTSRPSPWV